MKTVIIGGVAAGASAAARLRRLDENMEIVLLEQGKYISYANCGLPYHLGGVIAQRDNLLVMPLPKFRAWYNIDIRTENQVTAIDPDRKQVTVQKSDGSSYVENYDKLLIATGSRPRALTVPGADDSRIHSLWTIPDMDALVALANGAKKALVIGGGFIGLEAAENLHQLGLEVTILHHSAHILPSVDAEMAYFLTAELLQKGIDVQLNAELAAFENNSGKLVARLTDGREFPADLVVSSVGVQPNSELAQQAGLKLGRRGHIEVDSAMQTSQPDIYAAGDVVEIVERISGQPASIPLAGPANKQGRIAATNIAGGHAQYSGTFGASVIKIGNLAAASIGLTEQKLRKMGLKFRKIYSHPASHAGYYPGGSQLHFKLLFDEAGRILGAQGVGTSGVDKRIDVIGTAMAAGITAPELAELELAYAPPFNSAKDPVNYLGMIADNVLSKLSELAYVEELTPETLILDVREPGEFAAGHIPGAINIPLGTIRERYTELDSSRPIVAHCQVGLRGYLAERILRQKGFKVKNLSGGFVTWKSFHAPLPSVAR